MPPKYHPKRVAIVGRPNVGKSTLFNRLVGKRLALVDDLPGVTRDRREGDASLGDLRFIAIDTAGLDEAAPESLAGRMRTQTEAAVRSADVSLFVVDARAGVTPLDTYFADMLRTIGKPTLVVANKAEGKRGDAGTLEAFSLGLGEPVPISAEHGDGMADLYEALAAHLDDDSQVDHPAEGRPINVAIVGRPNVGKSTLINRVVGEDRLLTGPEAGITRDSISIDWAWKGAELRLFDTAGLRRKARVEGKLEKLAVADALRAVRFAEVAILVLDVTQPFEKQDLQIADLIESEGRAIVIAADKWDLVDERQKTLATLRERAERLLPQIRGVAVVPVSGLTGEGIERLINEVVTAHEIWNRRLPTAKLNRFLSDVVERHPPPAVSGRRIKLRYLTQTKARPPTFVAFCSRPEKLPDAWRRYLVNAIRETFDLPGTPIRLLLRKGENPFEGRRKRK